LVPLDPAAFLNEDVAIHYGFDEQLGTVRTESPHGFLFSRSVFGFGARQDAVPQPESKSRGRIAEVVAWTDGELHLVGGRSTTFVDNHLAHYKGWTVLIARDLVDNDWGGQACEGIYKDLFSFFEGQRDDAAEAWIADTFVASREEAFEMVKREIDAVVGREHRG
jgi:hypothetical protein